MLVLHLKTGYMKHTTIRRGMDNVNKAELIKTRPTVEDIENAIENLRNLVNDFINQDYANSEE